MNEADVFELNRDYVTYEDFGAIGDGKTEDFGAIYRTHEYANAHGLAVKGTHGKSYYIKDTKLGTDKVHTAIIKTSVDFCGANFIIDDTELTVMKDYPELRAIADAAIFSVEPEEEHEMFKIEDSELLSKIAAQGINQKTKKIDLGLGLDCSALIIPHNSAHTVYRRRGLPMYNGGGMHEIIVVDKDGNVSEETPIMFSYANIDYIEVYKLDPRTAITIENGVFTTLESRVNHYIEKEDGTREYIYHGYIHRGFMVTRSYTTLKNIQHIAKGGFSLLERAEQNLEGAMYQAFFRTAYADHITLKDCIMQGRTAPGPGGGHSSYDFAGVSVNKIVLDGCVQSNFWVTVDPVTYEIKSATEYAPGAVGHARRTDKNAYIGLDLISVNDVTRRLCWGIGGTSYCKNMEYINSTLTRFDAHAGLYNGKIINSNISCMALVGYGDFVMENSNWYQFNISTINQLVHLRADYGCQWSGNVFVKNVNGYMANPNKFDVVHYKYSNWYYGYTCTFPNITLDNVRYFNGVTEEPLAAGYKGKLVKFPESFARMHLGDSGVPSIFAVNDFDGDGYIDEPRFISDEEGTLYPACDLDGDGRVGNTSLKYDDYINAPMHVTSGLARPSYYRGAEHPTCTANLNKIRPPRYIRILNNKNENGEPVCDYIIKDTAHEGISDGGWYRDENTPDTFGGFFGGTKFIYGDGENDYVLGTAGGESVGETFVFTKDYDAEK